MWRRNFKRTDIAWTSLIENHDAFDWKDYELHMSIFLRAPTPISLQCDAPSAIKPGLSCTSLPAPDSSACRRNDSRAPHVVARYSRSSTHQHHPHGSHHAKPNPPSVAVLIPIIYTKLAASSSVLGLASW